MIVLRMAARAAREMVLFAVILILVVAALAGALVYRLLNDRKRGRRFRTVLKEWLEEREQRERRG